MRREWRVIVKLEVASRYSFLTGSKHMNSITLRRAVSLMLLTCIAALADDAEQKSDQIPAEAEIRGVLDQYVATYNLGDAEALASMWSDQGVFFDESTQERIVGRAAIQRDFDSMFATTEGLLLSCRVEAIRFIRPEVVEVTGQAVTVRPNEYAGDSTFTAILVRDDDRWVFDSIHENLIPPRAQASDQLRALEFLVGHWIDDNDDVIVDTNVQWTANRSFLVRSYTIDRAGQLDQGTQIIGWDPREDRLRCWMFDSDGSFGDGTWDATDDGWNVKIRQTLSDGRIAGGTQVITVSDENTLIIKSVGCEIEGTALPASEPVRVVRVDDGADE